MATMRENDLENMARAALCVVASTAVALADLAEVRALQDVQSHVGGVMADEVLWGCIENLKGLNARLKAELEKEANSHAGN